MPKVVITYAVEASSGRLEGKLNAQHTVEFNDYVAHDGSNNIAITADVQDLDALQAMLASPPPEVAAAMEEHGVVQPISSYAPSPTNSTSPYSGTFGDTRPRR